MTVLNSLIPFGALKIFKEKPPRVLFFLQHLRSKILSLRGDDVPGAIQVSERNGACPCPGGRGGGRPEGGGGAWTSWGLTSKDP